MTKEQLKKQRDDLHRMLGKMLRLTADPDPLHPNWSQTRQDAAAVWHVCKD